MEWFEKQPILEHPRLQTCFLDPTIMALYWYKRTSAEDKRALIKKYELIPIHVIHDSTGALRTNTTSRLTWIRARDGRPITNSLVSKLESSKEVEWLSGLYRKGPTSSDDTSFCVHPQYLYFKDEAAYIAEAVAGISDTEIDRKRSSLMPTLTALYVESVSLAEERGAIKAAEIIRRLPRYRNEHLDFENIPFASPFVSPVDAEKLVQDQKWVLEAVNADAAWDIYAADVEAAKVAIAILDYGVDSRHPDLNVIKSYDALTGQIDDSLKDGHASYARALPLLERVTISVSMA